MGWVGCIDYFGIRAGKSRLFSWKRYSYGGATPAISRLIIERTKLLHGEKVSKLIVIARYYLCL